MAGRVILPAANLVISKIRKLFSREPAMTLKIVPVLIIGADEYGHLITVWRFGALGFFISFTAPKLYSSYSYQISSKVRSRVMVGPEGLRVVEHGTEAIVPKTVVTFNRLLVEVVVLAPASGFEGYVFRRRKWTVFGLDNQIKKQELQKP